MPDDQARQLVEAEVTQRIERWAGTIGLTPADKAFDRFRQELTDALHACMRAHEAGQRRRYARFSDLRKDLLALAKAAKAAAQRLRKVEDILTRLPPMQHDPAFRLAHDPHSTAFELDGLTEASRRHAEECKLADRGGPSKMRAFAALADGLIQAYQHATKKTGKGRGAREGPLLDLIQAVLPTARHLGKLNTGKLLQVPTEDGLGEYLHKRVGHHWGS